MKISQLNVFDIVSGFDEMAVTTGWNKEIRKVNVSDFVYEDEEKAIERIREIFKSGKLPVIMPYKK